MNKTLLMLIILLVVGGLLYANTQIQKKSAGGADFLITFEKIEMNELSLAKIPIVRNALNKAEAASNFASLKRDALLKDLHLKETTIKHHKLLTSLIDTCDPGERKDFTPPNAIIIACGSQIPVVANTLIDKLGYQLESAAKGGIFLKNNKSDVYKDKKGLLCSKIRNFSKQYITHKGFPPLLMTYYFSECHERGDAFVFSKPIDDQFKVCIQNKKNDEDYVLEKNPCVENVIGTADFSKIPTIVR